MTLPYQRFLRTYRSHCRSRALRAMAACALAFGVTGCDAVPWSSVYKGKQMAADALTDPDSAKFRNVKFYKNSRTRAVCGEINGKNRFGGYTGFRKFTVDMQTGAVEIEPDLSGLTKDEVMFDIAKVTYDIFSSIRCLDF